MGTASAGSDLPPGPVRRGLKAAAGQPVTEDDFTDEEKSVGMHLVPQQRRSGELGGRRTSRAKLRFRLRRRSDI